MITFLKDCSEGFGLRMHEGRQEWLMPGVNWELKVVCTIVRIERDEQDLQDGDEACDVGK